MVDILIIGATGFCGRHAARYVLEHPDRSKYTVGLATRSRSKFASVGLPVDDTVQIFEVDVFDERTIESAVKQAKVVLNCAGPYWHYGTPVVRACARNGVHYVDITGETPWILDMIKTYDYLATKTHAIIVPSCGVDSVPADASVHLASKALAHAPLGTSTTVVTTQGGDVHERLGAVPVPGARSPPPRLVYRLGRAYVGGVFVFGALNRAVVQRTAGLLELARLRAPRAGGGGGASGPPVGYGPAFTYTEFAPTGGVVSAFLMSVAIGVTFAALTAIAPVRVELFLAPVCSNRPLIAFIVPVAVQASGDAAGSGPADHTLENGSMDSRGSGTLLTAALVGESALALLFDKLPPLAAEGGVLTPMTAFGDSLVRRLEANARFEITSGIVDNPDDDISGPS
ncbi:Saccharopine dehydrogenase-domain-containing protein [Russula brevipes]|nr:Saccharopine dehydrogenase-domain-containing protein [Russula brevipes]